MRMEFRRKFLAGVKELDVTPLDVDINDGLYKEIERERDGEKMARTAFPHYNHLRILLKYRF